MRKEDRCFFFYGTIMLGSELWKQYTLTFLVGHGNYDWWYFPFQLCSAAMYLCLLLPFVHSNFWHSTILTFLMTYNLLGGIFVFFDTSGMRYPLLRLTVHSYIWHLLLILIGIVAGFKQKASFRDKPFNSFAGSTLLYVLGCLFATILNFIAYPFGDINMFYISPHYKMKQFVFRDIAVIIGNGNGIFFYIIMIILGAFILFYLWILWSRHSWPLSLLKPSNKKARDKDV